MQTDFFRFFVSGDNRMLKMERSDIISRWLILSLRDNGHWHPCATILKEFTH